MADVREELQVEGIHCMRCVQTIATALDGSPGVLGASANLVGDVVVILAAADDEAMAEVHRRLSAAGFPVVQGRGARGSVPGATVR